MKQSNTVKTKRGAASFYIVAFSTLILVVLAMSFAAIIISEVSRTSNDDLAQSAYDSALAGIEDAKLAYYNYQSCLESQKDFSGVNPPSGGGAVSCEDIVYWMKNPDCYMVGHILGRILKDRKEEVYIKETIGNSQTAMQQAYTCVRIDTTTNDYRTTLSSSNSTRVAQVKLKNQEAKDVSYIKVSWYSNTDGSDYQYSNFNNSTNKVTFPTLATKAATPPTISFGIVQTDTTFSLEEFDKVDGIKTNRGTVFLVPTDSKTAKGATPDNYIGAYGRGGTGKEDINYLTAADIVKSNDRTVKNLPYAVYCDQASSEFACSTTIELPEPIAHLEGTNAIRNKDTFLFVVSIPYGQPSTDVAIELCNSQGCTKQQTTEAGTEEVVPNTVELSNMQAVIDSTGRANDLYRRVEARIDTADVYFPYPLYAIELLGEGGLNLNKNMTVTCEYQSWGEFGPTCP